MQRKVTQVLGEVGAVGQADEPHLTSIGRGKSNLQQSELTRPKQHVIT